jgi:hypothetical protein
MPIDPIAPSRTPAPDPAALERSNPLFKMGLRNCISAAGVASLVCVRKRLMARVFQ